MKLQELQHIKNLVKQDDQKEALLGLFGSYYDKKVIHTRK